MSALKPKETPASAQRRANVSRDWLDAPHACEQLGIEPDELQGYRVAGCVLAVWSPERGTYLYPPFQFRPAGIHPIMEELLDAMPAGDGSGWSRAEWFLSPHARLRGKAPSDIWAEGQAKVLALALHEFRAHPDTRW